MWDSFREVVKEPERVVFLGDPKGRPATAKRVNIYAATGKKVRPKTTQQKKVTINDISLPIINDNDNQNISKDTLVFNEQFEAIKNCKKFQAIVNEKRRVLVDNRDRSIRANKPSTMFDSWSATERSNVVIKENQAMEQMWKDSAKEYLCLKSNYDSEKAKTTFQTGRGQNPMSMTELFHQHRHHHPRAAESSLFLRRPFSASAAQIPADLTSLENELAYSNSSVHKDKSDSQEAIFKNKPNSDSLRSIFTNIDDSRTRLQPRPQTSLGIGSRDKAERKTMQSFDSTASFRGSMESLHLQGHRNNFSRQISDTGFSLETLDNEYILDHDDGKSLSPSKIDTIVPFPAQKLTSNLSQPDLIDNQTIMSGWVDNNTDLKDSSKIDKSFYFGEKAKIAFFSKFRQLSSGFSTSSIVQPDRDRRKDKDGEKKWNRSTQLKEVKKIGVGDEKPIGDISPRTKFLQMYMQISMNPPLPVIIRLDPLSEEINLANMGLKDAYVIILAEVLNDLPGVRSLNHIYTLYIYIYTYIYICICKYMYIYI
jgi:hypothetical protein